MPRFTTPEFQEARRWLLQLSNADRAYLRQWLNRWTDEQGRILRDAEPIPTQDAEAESQH